MSISVLFSHVVLSQNDDLGQGGEEKNSVKLSRIILPEAVRKQHCYHKTKEPVSSNVGVPSDGWERAGAVTLSSRSAITRAACP